MKSLGFTGVKRNGTFSDLLEVPSLLVCRSATLNGQNAYQQYVDSTQQDFKARYIAQCMGQAIENFNAEFVLDEYHYTLYYYDQGGNLVRTVPPAGVNVIDLGVSGQTIKNERAARTANPAVSKSVFTSHTLVTTYSYNTLNQLVQQVTPDGGTTRFWYDALGRIVLSQNAKQGEADINGEIHYSYTTYDAQGRIAEVGQLHTSNDITTQTFATQQTWLNDANFPDLIDGAAVSSGNPRIQVTKTYYDAVAFSSAASRMPSTTQDNLRKRVASAAIYEVYTGADNDYVRASHYSYDIHGNVQELVQEDSTLRSLDDVANSRYQSYKTFEYSYDLLSGNVNMLAYQHGQADAFYYRYEYDADNRVIAAYTHAGSLISRDIASTAGSGGSAGSVMASASELWDRDAKYFYYQHGPLARTEVGQNKVQATDYAYTLHGWIKGVNSNALTSAKDMGNDGNRDPNDGPTTNQYVGKDVYGYQLTYYDTTGHKDYTSITTNPAFASQTGSSLSTSSYNLWNGNIKNMVTSVSGFMPNGRPQARAFTYDQLNRIKVAQVDTAYTVATNTWGASGNINKWKENFAYDANGNITSLVRHGNSPTTMDSLSYHYTSGKNQLEYVDDAISAGNYGTDIDDQGTGNYKYDKIGNLVSDVSEEIDTIVWNVYGKIERVVRTATSTKSDLEFHYDAMGNRVCKIVKPRDGSAVLTQEEWTYTYYVRDASGNVISVYDRNFDYPTTRFYDQFTLEENHLYGSSRVGIKSDTTTIASKEYSFVAFNADGTFDTSSPNALSTVAASTTTFTHEIRRKSYELSNHLGNVLVTVSDARTATNNSGTVVAFSAVVISASDYYAFGSSMVGRTISGDYRYTFNGKEKENEIAEGDLDFGARVYDSRLGRWFAKDPYRQFVYSTYVAFANMPVGAIDIDGGWVPGVDEHGRIYVEAEAGDDPTSLMAFFSGTANARHYLPGFFFTRAFNDHTTVVTGQRIYFNSTNVYSQAMADAYKHPDKYQSRDANYNCHTAAINGSKGQAFQDGGVMDVSERDEIINAEYENVAAQQAIFGTTLVTYGYAHTATYFGTGSDGTVYLFSKNGQFDAPKIMSAHELSSNGPNGPLMGSYGTVRNINDESNDQSNIYNKNIDDFGRSTNNAGTAISTTGYYNPKFGKVSDAMQNAQTVTNQQKQEVPPGGSNPKK